MRWGTPAEYAWLYNASLSAQYKYQLLQWLEWENPNLWQLVKKELARGDRKGSANPAAIQGEN